MRGLWLLLVGLLLVIGGSWAASRVQSADGTRVTDIRFAGDNGATLRALLYVPAGVDAAHKAPAILAVHGYINTAETQSAFAIEFARRGYVVLALDQAGHGYSSGPAFAGGFGGPAALRYLRSLPYVDTANIGLEGHSMGGWTVLAAAAALPDGYRALVLEGSATGKPFAADGTPVWPRNVALVFSKFDEFSQLMWGVDRAQDVATSSKLQALFGTSAPVVPGRIYGDIAAGTARRLTTPVATHPGDHISHAAVADSLDWFARTLHGGKPRAATDQIWLTKEIATGVALIGIVPLLIGVFDLLLALPGFAVLRRTPEPRVRRRDGQWRRTYWLTALLPPLTLLPVFIAVTLWVPPSALLPQTVSTQVAAWMLVNAAIGWALDRRRPPVPHMTPYWGRSLAIALLTAGIAYALVVAVATLFTVDLRFWVVALKPLSAEQARIAPVYLLPMLLFFVVSQRALLGRLMVAGEAPWRQTLVAVGALAGGFVLLLGVDYAVLFVTGRLPTGFDPLTTVIAIQFVPLLAALGIIAVACWRRTASALPGALLSALLVAWYVVAGTATQFG